MSKKSILESAAHLADSNINAAKLLLQLNNAESGNDIMSALESYDAEVSNLVSAN